MEIEKYLNHILILGPTKSGKTKFLTSLLRKELKQVFDVIILICSTFKVNDEFKNFAKNDKHFFVMIPNEDDEDVEFCLKIIDNLFHDNKKDKILIILDDCAFEKSMKQKSGILSKMAFSSRHRNIFLYIISQQKNSICNTFRSNVGMVISFYHSSGMDKIFEEYLNISKEGKKNICEILKNEKYSRLCISVCPPFSYHIEI